MRAYRWVLLLLLVSSCGSQEIQRPASIQFVEVRRDCFSPPKSVMLDTSTTLIRAKNKEIHLLRVEIDALKKRLGQIRKLQVLDSIIKKVNE